jgi:predicted  nucleic acid-binding Zn-ribbon protein
MSEDKTKEMNDSKSFESRVFERFERIEGRLVNVEIKISKLEERQYDTKPIWEQALAAIGEINSRLESMDARFDSMDARFDSMDARFDRVDARFDKLETEMSNGFRGVERKMDVLNKYLLEVRADQRYLEDRLENIEARENST